MVEEKSVFARRMRRARDARGLTQKELAEKIGRGQITVSSWERDETSPTIKDLKLIAELLGVRLSWLVGDGEVMEVK